MEPNGSLNVGSIARLCANFEINELRVISLNAIHSLKQEKWLSRVKISRKMQNL